MKTKMAWLLTVTFSLGLLLYATLPAAAAAPPTEEPLPQAGACYSAELSAGQLTLYRRQGTAARQAVASCRATPPEEGRRLFVLQQGCVTVYWRGGRVVGLHPAGEEAKA